MTNVPKFSLKVTNGYKQRLIDQLHYGIVAYRKSNMPGDSPIISSDAFLVLQFDSHFCIWRYFETNRLISLKLFIDLRLGPLTHPFRHFDCDTNGKSSNFGAYDCSDYP